MSARDYSVEPVDKLYAEFDRKVGLSQLSCAAERVAPALVPPVYTLMAATTATFMGGFEQVPETIRPYVWLGAGIAAIAPIPFMVKKNPLQSLDKEVGARRLDEDLGNINKPAYNLLHRQPPEHIDEGALSGWVSAQERNLREELPKMNVRGPGLDIPPLAKALGVALLVGVGASAIDAGDERGALLREAFNFETPPPPPEPLEFRAWTAPPEGIEGAEFHYLSDEADVAGVIEVPAVHEASTLNFYIVGKTPDITVNGISLSIEKEIDDDDSAITYVYAPYTVEESETPYMVSIENGPMWSIPVIPDAAPEVMLTGVTKEGYDRAVIIRCHAFDDFGIEFSAIDFSIPGQHPQADIPDQADLPPIPVDPKEFCQ